MKTAASHDLVRVTIELDEKKFYQDIPRQYAELDRRILFPMLQKLAQALAVQLTGNLYGAPIHMMLIDLLALKLGEAARESATYIQELEDGRTVEEVITDYEAKNHPKGGEKTA